jgi:hypothetical protein
MRYLLTLFIIVISIFPAAADAEFKTFEQRKQEIIAAGELQEYMSTEDALKWAVEYFERKNDAQQTEPLNMTKTMAATSSASQPPKNFYLRYSILGAFVILLMIIGGILMRFWRKKHTGKLL